MKAGTSNASGARLCATAKARSAVVRRHVSPVTLSLARDTESKLCRPRDIVLPSLRRGRNGALRILTGCATSRDHDRVEDSKFGLARRERRFGLHRGLTVAGYLVHNSPPRPEARSATATSMRGASMGYWNRTLTISDTSKAGKQMSQHSTPAPWAELAVAVGLSK